MCNSVSCTEFILRDQVHDFSFVAFLLNVPVNKFFSRVGTKPPLSRYYQYFLGGKSILLKDTTRGPE